MLKSTCILLLIITTSLHAQQPKGKWLLAYVKALQPIYTMVEQDGEYQIDESEPQDSSFLYNSGLTVIEFGKGNVAKSYSWGEKEDWTVSVKNNTIELFGKRDTLYGSFNKEQLIVSSTLDDRPTFYHFEPLNKKKLSTFSLEEKEWAVDLENHHLGNQILIFSNSKSKSQIDDEPTKSKVYFTYKIGNLWAVEYDFQPDPEHGFEQELGTIYFYKPKKGVITGVFYPITDGIDQPQKHYLKLIPLDK